MEENVTPAICPCCKTPFDPESGTLNLSGDYDICMFCYRLDAEKHSGQEIRAKIESTIKDIVRKAFKEGAVAQRIICAEHAKTKYDYKPGRPDCIFVDRESILSAPLAE